MTYEIGHQARFAIKKQTANPAWDAVPMLLAAGDGIRVNSDSIAVNAELVKRMGIMGGAFSLPGVLGAKKPAGDLDIDLFYRGAEWRAAAGVFGLDTVTNPSAGVYQHEMALQQNHAGIVYTLGDFGLEAVREYGSAKAVGFEMSWEEGAQLGKLTQSLMFENENQNVGAADAAFVVASVAVATGAQTILAAAAADFQPSPLTFTKVAGITAINVTITAIDEFGDTYVVTFTETSFVSNLWTDTRYVKRVLKVNINSFTGTGNVSCGVSNGINKTSGAASVTEDANRDSILFAHMDVRINAQGGADFLGEGSVDEQYLSAFKVGVQLNMESRVTSRRGRLIDEPSTGGSGDFVRVSVGMNFKAEDNKNKSLLLRVFDKSPLKAKITFTGPPIAATTTPHQLILWLNNIQYESGALQLKGPGNRPFDLAGMAHFAYAGVPTGFPTGHTQPLRIQLINGDLNAYV